MGFTLNARKKPVIGPTPTQTVADMQAIADFAEMVGNHRIGVASDRTGLSAGELYNGLYFFETDTNSIYVYNSGWKLWHRAPTAYTPALTNIGGSPTIAARYAVAAGMVEAEIVLTLTSGSTVGSAPGFGLPLAARTPSGFQMIGDVTLRKSGQWIQGALLLATTTRIDPVLKLVSGSVINMSTNVNATSPFTWASGDSMTLKFSYEAA